MKISYTLLAALGASIGLHAAAFASDSSRVNEAVSSPVLVSQLAPLSATPVMGGHPVLTHASGAMLNHPSLKHAVTATAKTIPQSATFIQELATPAPTFVTSVNAGTVRVNNLANLESFIGVVAPVAGFAFASLGVWLIVRGFRTAKTSTIVWGFMTLVSGLAFPASVNWLVASARDAGMCG